MPRPYHPHLPPHSHPPEDTPKHHHHHHHREQRHPCFSPRRTDGPTPPRRPRPGSPSNKTPHPRWCSHRREARPASKEHAEAKARREAEQLAAEVAAETKAVSFSPQVHMQLAEPGCSSIDTASPQKRRPAFQSHGSSRRPKRWTQHYTQDGWTTTDASASSLSYPPLVEVRHYRVETMMPLQRPSRIPGSGTFSTSYMAPRMDGRSTAAVEIERYKIEIGGGWRMAAWKESGR